MKVCKFGGTSLASAEQIRKAANIVLADKERKIVVVSAPGKRFKEDIKVTDLLISYANKYIEQGAAEKELDEVLARFEEIASGLELKREIIDNITKNIKGQLMVNIKDKNLFIETIKAAGEDNSARLLAYYLQDMGIDAKYINPKEAGLFVSKEFGNAQVLPESYNNLYSLREEAGILIFPGFFGYSPDGFIVTFSRGGSDITGSILAAATKAKLYENFTDVDSVFTVNPSFITNPHKITELTFREMRELSYAGFTVFNEEALMPAYRAGVPVNIKNTNNPEAPGTMIVFKRQYSTNPVIGIASDNGFCSIYVSKYLMNREIGFGRKLLMILEDEGLSYEHTPSGIDNISLILREEQFDKEVETRVINRIKEDLEVDDIAVQHDLTLIMIVGEGMRRTIGIAAKATKALSQANVNIEMINQGSSEVSMMFGIHAEDERKAIESLYHEFF